MLSGIEESEVPIEPFSPNTKPAAPVPVELQAETREQRGFFQQAGSAVDSFLTGMGDGVGGFFAGLGGVAGNLTCGADRKNSANVVDILAEKSGVACGADRKDSANVVDILADKQ